MPRSFWAVGKQGVNHRMMTMLRQAHLAGEVKVWHERERLYAGDEPTFGRQEIGVGRDELRGVLER